MASPAPPRPRHALLTATALALACSGGDDGRETMGSATLLTEGTATTTAATDTDTDASTSATTSGGTAGESESQGTTDDSTTSKVSDSDSDSDPTTTTTTDPTDTDTTGDPPCDGGGGGEFSYLWVSNTDQGSVSRVNTLTLTEEARFWSDPAQSGAADPSRTSVNIDGRFMVVANRGAGTVTKIAANTADCVDRNGNGVIETSPNKDTLLNYADEECILWTAKINTPFSVGAGPRGTTFGLPTFNQKTCEYEDEKVWVGTLSAPGQAQMTRLNSYTGEIEATVPLPNWPVNIDGINGYAPYGAAIDPDGAVWTTGVFTNVAYRIDPVTLEVQRWDSPNADSHYGMGIDAGGRVWFANWQGHGGVSVFDPKSESWGLVAGSEGNLFRGVATDSAGNVWLSSNAGGALGCGLIQVNGDALTITNFHTFEQCGTPLGIGFDLENKLWLVDYNGWAYQMDPITLEKKLLPIANVHYTYSDITGSGLAGIKPG
jgi:hypothetical protein